jgi:hypothetical protein
MTIPIPESFIGRTFALPNYPGRKFKINRIPGDNEFWPSFDGDKTPHIAKLSNNRRNKMVVVDADDPNSEELLFCCDSGIPDEFFLT